MGMLAHGTPKHKMLWGREGGDIGLTTERQASGPSRLQQEDGRGNLWLKLLPGTSASLAGRKELKPVVGRGVRKLRLRGFQPRAPSSGVPAPPAGPRLPSGGGSAPRPPPADTAARDARGLSRPLSQSWSEVPPAREGSGQRRWTEGAVEPAGVRTVTRKAGRGGAATRAAYKGGAGRAEPELLSGIQSPAEPKPEQPAEPNSALRPQPPSACLTAPRPAPSVPLLNETVRDDQEDVPERPGAEDPGQELLPHGGPRLVQGGQDGHRVAIPDRPLRGRLHAHHRGLPPQVLLHPRRDLPAGHPRHVRQPPVPRHAAPLHPYRRRVHPGVQPGQPRLLRGGSEAQAADSRHQVVPEEQDQGGRGRAPGHLWQQGGPRLPPPGRATRHPSAGGHRPPALRLLRDLGQEEQQPGSDVPRALRHGQPAARDEPGPAPPRVGAALRGAAPEGAAGQEAAASGRRPRRRLGHPGALGAQAECAQRPHVHPREGQRRQPGQGQGALRHQLGAPAPTWQQSLRRPCSSSVRATCPKPRASSYPAPQPLHQGESANREGTVICSERNENWLRPDSPHFRCPLAPTTFLTKP